MIVFLQQATFITAVMRDIVVEEVESYVDAHHVADIEGGNQSHSQTEDEELELSAFDQALDAESDKRQKDQVIQPHEVMRLHDGVGAKSITGGEDNGIQRLCRAGFVEVVGHGSAHGTDLQQDNNGDRLNHVLLGEEAHEEGEGA